MAVDFGLFAFLALVLMNVNLIPDKPAKAWGALRIFVVFAVLWSVLFGFFAKTIQYNRMAMQYWYDARWAHEKMLELDSSLGLMLMSEDARNVLRSEVMEASESGHVFPEGDAIAGLLDLWEGELDNAYDDFSAAIEKAKSIHRHVTLSVVRKVSSKVLLANLYHSRAKIGAALGKNEALQDYTMALELYKGTGSAAMGSRPYVAEHLKSLPAEVRNILEDEALFKYQSEIFRKAGLSPQFGEEACKNELGLAQSAQ